MEILTTNLVLRTPLVEDASFFTKLENDEVVKRWLNGPSGRKKEEYENSFRSSKDSCSYLTVLLKNERIPIGRCGLLENLFHYELHLALFKEYWGKGYGQEIAVTLKKFNEDHHPDHKLSAIVHPENVGSIKI